MKIVKPYIIIEDDLDGHKILERIERAGRTCYKSEHNISEGSARKFISSIIKRGHESVIEHEKITVRIVCDRGVTHELVRHRIASYSQESTRYCNYTGDKFGNELTFIEPCFFETGREAEYELWKNTMAYIEGAYFEMVAAGATPEEARSILPNSLKTEIVATMNLRQWRHFLKLRTHAASHPQMRQTAKQILDAFKKAVPVVFDDINDTDDI